MTKKPRVVHTPRHHKPASSFTAISPLGQMINDSIDDDKHYEVIVQEYKSKKLIFQRTFAGFAIKDRLDWAEYLESK